MGSLVVVGTVNLSPKAEVQSISPSTKFPGRWLVVNADGSYTFIDADSIVKRTGPNAGPNDEGAYQVCRKVPSSVDGIGTLEFKFGTLSYSENELF